MIRKKKTEMEKGGGGKIKHLILEPKHPNFQCKKKKKKSLFKETDICQRWHRSIFYVSARVRSNDNSRDSRGKGVAWVATG